MPRFTSGIPTHRVVPGPRAGRPTPTDARSARRRHFAGWAAAEQAGVPLMVFVPGQAPALAPIAARHPRLRLILDHLARPGALKDDAAFEDLDQVLALAKYPAVAAKVSALPCYSSEPYPFPRLHTHVRRVYEAFGPRRMLWGTDYSRLTCPYADAIRLF